MQITHTYQCAKDIKFEWYNLPTDEEIGISKEERERITKDVEKFYKKWKKDHPLVIYYLKIK